MLNLDLRNKACSVVCSVLLWPVAITWTQTDSIIQSRNANIEIFTDGKMFESLDEYRRYQEVSRYRPEEFLLPSVPLMPKTTDEMIVYMENLSDDDLRALVKELRIRRAELFDNESLDFYMSEMQKMLEIANADGELSDIELNSSTMKTITISDRADQPLPNLQNSNRYINNSAEVKGIQIDGQEGEALLSPSKTQTILRMLAQAEADNEGTNQMIEADRLKKLLKESDSMDGTPVSPNLTTSHSKDVP